MTPEQAVNQSVAYVHDTPPGIEMVNRFMLSKLQKLYRCHSGCLLVFEKSANYLMVVSARLPLFGPPQPIPGGGVEFEFSGQFRDTIALSSPPSTLAIDPRFWQESEEESRHLVGKVLTGYSPSKSRIEDGQQVESCMLEFDIVYFLVVTPVSVYVMLNNKQAKPS